jgi:serine protease Do
MKSRMIFFLPAAALAAAAPCGCNGAAKSIDFQAIIENAKQKVYPSLVFVKPIQEQYVSGERQRQEVWGSGVIISEDGYVVTNNHVAEKAIQVHCVLGDKELVEADVVGLDPETDLALVKLKPRAKGPPLPLPLSYATFGDSNEVEAGQFVMALGAPFGFTRSISLGIISNTTRYIGFTTRYQYNLWIQTDAAINPGNSGGPLVDTQGRVIGINTLGVGGAGIGFAVPSNVVKDVVAKLKSAAAEGKEGGKEPVKVKRAWTGLQLQALIDLKTTTLTDSKDGVLIQSVDKNSPAEQAGIRNGDILLRIGQQPILGKYVEDLPPIRVFLSELPVDQPMDVVVRRAGKQLTFAVAPVIKGKFEGEDFDCRRWNLTVKEITKFSNPGLHYLHPAGGVYIQGVRYPGNAQDAGLRANDIILKIGDKQIKTLKDVEEIYEKLVADKNRPEKKVLITIKRGVYLDWETLDWTKDYLQED